MEFLTATNAQRLLHLSMDIPGTTRLARIKDDTVIGSSGVVDFFCGGNADVISLMSQNGTVKVGRDIVFGNVTPASPRKGRRHRAQTARMRACRGTYVCPGKVGSFRSTGGGTRYTGKITQ